MRGKRFVPAETTDVLWSFLEKQIRSRFRRLLAVDVGLQPRDLFLEKSDPFVELADRQQRQLLADLVRDLFPGPVVIIERWHGRPPCPPQKIAGVGTVVTPGPDH